MSAETKLELLGLIDGAVRGRVGAHARVPGARPRRMCARTAGVRGCGRPGVSRTGGPVGDAVHRLLAWEEQAILDLIETVGLGRPLASQARAPRLLHRHGVRVALDAAARGAQEPRRAARASRSAHGPLCLLFPQVPWEKNRIWIWDATHFTRCKRVAYAIVDVVTRYWIGYLLTSEQTHTQVQLLFARALEDQGLLGPTGSRCATSRTVRSWSPGLTTGRR